MANFQITQESIRMRRAAIWLFGAIVVATLLYLWTSVARNDRDTVHAQGSAVPEPVTVLTRQWLPSDIFRLLLPITFSLPTGANGPVSLTITDMQYAGSGTTWSEGNFVAVATPDSSQPLGLAAGDANLTLQVLSSKLSAPPTGPSWFAVMNVRANWSPWQLQLSITNGVVGTRKGNAQSPPVGLAAVLANPTTIAPISNLPLSSIPAPIDSTHTLMLNVGTVFAPGTVSFVFVPTDFAKGWPVNGQTPQPVNVGDAPSNASMVAFLPNTFLQYLMADVFKDTAYGFTFGGQRVKAIPCIARANPSCVTTMLSGSPLAPSGISIFSTLQDSAGNPVSALQMDWSGSDLAFTKLSVAKNLCSSGAQCQTVGLLAQVGVLAFTQQFTQTQHLLRPVTVKNIGKFNLSGKQVQIRMLVENVHAVQTGMSVSGFTTLSTN